MSGLIPKFCYYAFGLSFPLNLLYLIPPLIFYKQLVKLFKNNYFRIFFILIPSTIIFIKLLRNDPFFLSDDFAHLNLVSNYSFLEIAKIALTRGIWVGHKIFTALWVFKGIFHIFGTKVEAYLFVNYLFHILNLLIFYKILEKIKKGTFVSVFVTFILGTFYLTWISNMHELMGGTFMLLTIYFWFRFLLSGKKYNWVSAVFYILAIFSKEITFLAVPALLLFSVFFHFNVKELNLKRVAKGFSPLIVIFLFFSVFYASTFLGYSRLPSDEGYKMAFSWGLLSKNLLLYTSMLVGALKSIWGRGIILFLIFLGFDLKKRKPVTTPFILSYFLFLIPPSLFANRISNYYTYIPSFFLFFAFALIFFELSKLKSFSNKLVVVLSIFIMAIGIFGLGKLFMDNCFLIQFPWKKEHKATFLSLAKRIDQMTLAGKLTPGSEIRLSQRETTSDMEELYDTGMLHLFMLEKQAQNFRFVYNKERNSLRVDAK